MANFLENLKQTKDEPQTSVATQDVALMTTEQGPATEQSEASQTTAATILQPEEVNKLQERPDMAQAHEALNSLMAEVSTGMQNSMTAIPAPAFNPFAGFGKVEDGMATPGYYSSSKGRVAGVTAEQVGGRFYFPLEVEDKLKAALEDLVKSGVYEKVDE